MEDLKSFEWLKNLESRGMCGPEMIEVGSQSLINPEFLIIHHSSTKEGNAEIFRKYHKETYGWRDIGYHFVIGNGTYSGDGEVEIGRPENEEGVHAVNYNDKSLGICLVGDFMKASPTVRQMASLRKLCKDKMLEYKIPPEKVLGHGEVNNTNCPGTFFDMEALRKELTPDYWDHWAVESIKKAIDAGIMTGLADGSWGPDQPLSRAELAIVLERLGLLGGEN